MTEEKFNFLIYFLLFGKKVVKIMFDPMIKGGKLGNSLSQKAVEGSFSFLGKQATPTDNQVVTLITGAHYIISRWKQTHITHTQTTLTCRQDPVTVTSYLHTLNTLPHTYTQLHRQYTHSLRRYGARFDNRQVDLALVRPE